MRLATQIPGAPATSISADQPRPFPPIEDNLPPGVNTSFILTVLVIGAGLTAIYTFFGYRDHVYPYRLISDLPSLPAADQPEERT